MCVVGGQGVSKEAGWRVAPGSKGTHSVCYLCTEVAKPERPFDMI